MQPLSEIDKSRENSITFLRLLAACTVIYGHSFVVVPGFGADWVVKLTNYAHAGIICLFIGFFSWHLAEKRVLRYKDVLPNYIERLRLRYKGVNS